MIKRPNIGATKPVKNANMKPKTIKIIGLLNLLTFYLNVFAYFFLLRMFSSDFLIISFSTFSV